MSRRTTTADGRIASGGKQPHRLARLIRVGVITLIVAACCYYAYGFGKLWADWRRVSQPGTTRLAATTEFDSPAMVLPLAGQWSFAELDWSLRSNFVGQADVAERFETLAAVPPHDSDEKLPDVSQELVEIADSLQIKPFERNGKRIYRFDKPHLKAQLTVRVMAGRTKAVSLAAAYPQSSDQWQLYEFIPRGASNSSTTSQPYLLPLPAGAERCGGRFADDGRALLELITLDSTADELFSLWKGAGWEVRRSGFGDSDRFSYLCARGDEVVYAWSADDRQMLKNLMLVRTPTRSDTGKSE